MYSNVYVQAVLVGGGYIALEVASQLAGEGVGVCILYVYVYFKPALRISS
jgi:pyruvate/2-oxoglutarate dehydrogenase complex dihydrolipoamide dehydrogenase (E3) component